MDESVEAALELGLLMLQLFNATALIFDLLAHLFQLESGLLLIQLVVLLELDDVLKTDPLIFGHDLLVQLEVVLVNLLLESNLRARRVCHGHWGTRLDLLDLRKFCLITLQSVD